MLPQQSPGKHATVRDVNSFSLNLFDNVIPDMNDTLFAPAMQSAETTRKPTAETAPQARASLWRHTLNEHAARRHGLATRSVFGSLPR